MDELTGLFPEENQRTLAESVLEYFRHQRKAFPNQSPISPDSDSLLGYLKHAWNDLIGQGKIDRSVIDQGKGYFNAQSADPILQEILKKLAEGGLLETIICYRAAQ